MLSPLTQSILLGLLAAVTAAVLMLAVHRRIRTIGRYAAPVLVAAFAAGVWGGLVLGVADVAKGALVLKAALWVLALVLVVRALGHYWFNVLLEQRWKVRVPPLLPRVAHGFVYVIGALGIVTLVFPGADLAPLLATSAITSLVLGLALQPILTNFFAGVVLALERPFRIHDWIQVGEHEGQVTDITWRTTYIRTRQNDTVIFPNSSVAQETLTNFLYPHPLHMARIYVGVHYRTPPHRVQAAILRAAETVGGVLEKPSPAVYVFSFDDSAITYEARLWIADMAPLRRIESDVRAAIWEEFRRQRIVIPFPIRTLEIARPERRRPEEGPRGQLFVAAGPDRGATVRFGRDGLSVGRGEGCGLVLADPGVSSRHLELSWEDGALRARDAGSSHGTLLNGAAITEETVRDLDRLEIGATTLVVEIDDDGS